jgi:hypothetical protein
MWSNLKPSWVLLLCGQCCHVFTLGGCSVVRCMQSSRQAHAVAVPAWNCQASVAHPTCWGCYHACLHPCWAGLPAAAAAGCAEVAQLLFRHCWYPAPMAWLPLLCQWKGRSKPGGPDMEDVGGASQWKGHALWLAGRPECAPPPCLVAPPSLSLLSTWCAPLDLPVPPPQTSVAPAACPLAGCNACGGGRHGSCPAAKQCPWRTQLTL